MPDQGNHRSEFTFVQPIISTTVFTEHILWSRHRQSCCFEAPALTHCSRGRDVGGGDGCAENDMNTEIQCLLGELGGVRGSKEV